MKDYLHEFFIPQLMKRLEAEAKRSSKCCGFCKNWDEYDDWPGYGDCKIGDPKELGFSPGGLGFDCDLGEKCNKFVPVFEIKVGINLYNLCDKI